MRVDMSQFSHLEVSQEEKKAVMDEITRQVSTWGLRLPDSPYLMFHFGLNDFLRTGETEFWVANEIEAGYCAKLIFVFDGQTCPYHLHKVKHETFFIVKGETRMVVEGKETVKAEGDGLIVVPGTRHSFTGKGPCLLLEASMPSVPGDSYFENRKIGRNGVL